MPDSSSSQETWGKGKRPHAKMRQALRQIDVGEAVAVAEGPLPMVVTVSRMTGPFGMMRWVLHTEAFWQWSGPT
jgi:hypothetical protein